MAMEQIDFVFADKATVPGWIGGNVRDEIVQHVLDMKPDRVLLLTDETVDSLHGSYFDLLQRPRSSSAVGETGAQSSSVSLPEVDKFVLPCGDACKSWAHLTSLMEWAFERGATKRTVVVAFGGGALLNVSGLFASMLFRGSKLVYVPTTLLAMHDVVTSLKTSICFGGRKNTIGTFYAPLKILIDVAFCQTLPRNELFSGLGELAKNAVLIGGKHAEGFCKALNKDSINSHHGGSGEEFVIDDETLAELLALGIEAKMEVLRTDAYEKVSGMIFEYGHTVSHALEKAYGDGVVPHGLGVTYGMLSTSYAAHKLGVMSAEDREEHDRLCWLLLKRWSLPEPRPSVEVVMGFAMQDSKRGLTSEAEDEISDVMVRRLGDVVHTATNNLSKFPKALTEEWLETMGFERAVPVATKTPSKLPQAATSELLEAVGFP